MTGGILTAETAAAAEKKEEGMDTGYRILDTYSHERGEGVPPLRAAGILPVN